MSTKQLSVVTTETCPRCGSNEIEGETYEADNTSVWQEVSCLECEAVWVDVYSASHRFVDGDLEVAC